MEKYESLREQYPEYVNSTQLSKICQIDNHNVIYLLKKGIIPSIDTGKRAWRYKIAIDDVIIYLYQRDKCGTMIPPGDFKSKKSEEVKPAQKSFYEIVYGYESELVEYFNFIYSDYKEVLTASDIAEMIGLNESTIRGYARNGFIKYLVGYSNFKYLIPKQYLFEFMTTSRFIEAQSDSEDLKRILEGFEIWKTTKEQSGNVDSK